MSQLSIGQLKGLTVNNNTITVPSGHTLYAPGHVVQVATSTSITSTSIATTSYTQVGGSALTVSITPKSINSKIIIFANIGYYSPAAINGYLSIFRNGTVNIGESGYYAYQAGEFNYGSLTLSDVPATTSQLTYSVYAKGGSTALWHVNYADGGGQVRSTITAMEIAQ